MLDYPSGPILVTWVYKSEEPLPGVSELQVLGRCDDESRVKEMQHCWF